jgi:glycosyltransferase involved in cell wall biosynthesis
MTAAVVVDAYAALASSGGIGRYVRDLAEALLRRPDAPPARFAYPINLRAAGQRLYPPASRRELPLPWRLLAPLLAVSVRAGLPLDALYGAPAVFHSTLGLAPRFKDAKLLSTVHDLTALLHPEWHPRRTSFLFQQALPTSLRHSDLVVCDSEFVRRQVQDLPGVDAARTRTVHLGVSPVFRPMPRAEAVEHVRRRFAIDGPFVLHVGTIEPRKNHRALIEAYEGLCQAGFPGPLVLVGQVGWRTESIMARLESSPVAARVMRLTGAHDQDLVALYSACTMLVFPSFEEGFGLPPLEAMACGAPVLSSLRSSLRELVEGVAVEIDPDRPAEIGDSMVRLWRDEAHRQAVAAGGPARAARFTQERFVTTMFGIYRELLGETA